MLLQVKANTYWLWRKLMNICPFFCFRPFLFLIELEGGLEPLLTTLVPETLKMTSLVRGKICKISGSSFSLIAIIRLAVGWWASISVILLPEHGSTLNKSLESPVTSSTIQTFPWADSIKKQIFASLGSPNLTILQEFRLLLKGDVIDNGEGIFTNVLHFGWPILVIWWSPPAVYM